jgi:hypothetical protein
MTRWIPGVLVRWLLASGIGMSVTALVVGPPVMAAQGGSVAARV